MDWPGGGTNCASSKFMMAIRNFEAPTKDEQSSPEEERAPRLPMPLFRDIKTFHSFR